jgi:hypothetical protein
MSSNKFIVPSAFGRPASGFPLRTGSATAASHAKPTLTRDRFFALGASESGGFSKQSHHAATGKPIAPAIEADEDTSSSEDDVDDMEFADGAGDATGSAVLPHASGESRKRRRSKHAPVCAPTLTRGAGRLRRLLFSY